MTEIKWVKLSVNMFNDEKIKLIRTMPEGDNIVIIWVQLLCLAGKTNDNGSIYMGQNIYYTDEMLATLCDQSLNTMRIAIKTLEQFNMIESDDNGLIGIVNWEKHQSTDKMSRIREQNRQRKRKYDLRGKIRELGYDPDNNSVPEDLERLEKYVEGLENRSNVTETLRNETEVRSKKLEERSKKKESNTPSKKELESDFDKLWALYPNKKGKKTALNAYIKAIKSGTTNKNIQKGIVAYNKLIKAEGTDIKYIAHGSTWFNQQRWEDDYSIQPKQIPYKNNKTHTRSESLPKWARDGYEPVKDKPVSAEEKAEMQRRIAEFRAMKPGKG